MSPETYLASSGVPVDDVRVELTPEPFVQVELPSFTKFIFWMSENLFGRCIVQATALASHGLSDTEVSELLPPPLALVLHHVDVRDRLHPKAW